MANKDLSVRSLVRLPIAQGATSPNPGASGALAYSITLNAMVIWDGTAWQEVWDAGTDSGGSGLDADLLDGQHGSFYQNANNLNAGTIPDARISGSYTGMTNLTGSGTVDFSKFYGNAADTVTAPSFSWTTDTNTGIYSPSSDQLAVTTGGVQRALFTSIGTTTTRLNTSLINTSNGTEVVINAGESMGQVPSQTGELVYVNAEGGLSVNTPDAAHSNWEAGFSVETAIIKGSSISLNGNQVWHAGNDGSGSGLDADTVRGYGLTASSTASTITLRDSAGDINARLFRSAYNNDSSIASTAAINMRVDNSTNNYIRAVTPAGFSTWLAANTPSSAMEAYNDTRYTRNNANSTYVYGTVAGQTLQQFVNALLISGGTGIVPAGTYYLAAPLVFNITSSTKAFSFIGQGPDTTIFSLSSSYNNIATGVGAFQFLHAKANNEGYHVGNFKITSYGTAYANYGGAISFTCSDTSTSGGNTANSLIPRRVENIAIVNYKTGIYASGIRNMIFSCIGIWQKPNESGTFDDAEIFNGIHLASTNSTHVGSVGDIVFDRCIIATRTNSTSGNGVYFQTSVPYNSGDGSISGIKFRSCDIHGYDASYNGGGLGQAVSMQATGGGWIQDVWFVDGCQIDQTFGVGIRLDAQPATAISRVTDIHVDNCYINKTSAICLYLVAGNGSAGTYSEVSDIFFTNNIVYQAAQACFMNCSGDTAFSIRNVTIQNNSFINCGVTGSSSTPSQAAVYHTGVDAYLVGVRIDNNYFRYDASGIAGSAARPSFIYAAGWPVGTGTHQVSVKDNQCSSESYWTGIVNSQALINNVELVGNDWTYKTDQVGAANKITSTVSLLAPNQLLLKNGTSSNKTIIVINDGTKLYLLPSDTATTEPNSTWHATQRPFSINLSDGLLESNTGQSFSGGTTISDTLTTANYKLGSIPANFWASSNTIYNLGGVGWLGTNGGYATSIFNNGYRNSSGGFTIMGVNGNTTTAGGLDITPTNFYIRMGVPSGTSIPVVASVDSSGVFSTSRYVSTVGTGTAPLTVSSTTKVTNLNADLLDGYSTGTSGNNIPILSGTNTWSSPNTFSSGITTNTYSDTSGRVLTYDFPINALGSVGDSDGYFDVGEAAEVFSFIASGPSQNYYVEGIVKIQSSNAVETLVIRLAVRSNTLPSYSWSASCERFSESNYVTATPVLWTKTNLDGGTPAEIKLVLKFTSSNVHDIECSFKVFQRSAYGSNLTPTALHISDTVPANFVEQVIPIRTELTSTGLKLDGYAAISEGSTVVPIRGNGTEGGELRLYNKDNSAFHGYVDVGSTGDVRLFTTLDNINVHVGQLGASTGGGVQLYSAGQVRLDTQADSKVLVKNSTGFGYGSGSGGSVTQTTSKTTSVTLNKPSGRIVTHNAALAAGASVTFLVDNTCVSNADVVMLNVANNSNYIVQCQYVIDNQFAVRLTSIAPISDSAAVDINFVILKGGVV